MRTDATFDKQFVPCPNASHLGFDKWRAQVGDLVLTKDGLLGRMIARIKYAPQIDNDKPIRNWILVVAMTGQMLEHIHERWIDPADVVRVQSIRNQTDVLSCFLSDDLVKSDIDEVRRYASDGWSTLDAYRKWFAESRQLTTK